MRLPEFREFLITQLGRPRPRGSDALLARQVGVKPAALYHWRERVRPIPDERLEDLARALGYPVEVRVTVPGGGLFVPPHVPVPVTGVESD